MQNASPKITQPSRRSEKLNSGQENLHYISSRKREIPVDSVISAVSTWKDLISKIFGEYPLAGALVTLLAVGAFLHLEQKERPGKAPTNILIVLLGWSILVPLTGLVLIVLGKFWDFIEIVAPIVTKVLGSFYAIYAKHPYLVLSLCALAIAAYFVWMKWWPKVLPSTPLRVLTLVAATVVVAHIASPIANALNPESFSPAAKASESSAINSAQPAKPSNSATQTPVADTIPPAPSRSASAPLPNSSTPVE
jgi:hypothetical protein